MLRKLLTVQTEEMEGWMRHLEEQAAHGADGRNGRMDEASWGAAAHGVDGRNGRMDEASWEVGAHYGSRDV